MNKFKKLSFNYDGMSIDSEKILASLVYLLKVDPFYIGQIISYSLCKQTSDTYLLSGNRFYHDLMHNKISLKEISKSLVTPFSYKGERLCYSNGSYAEKQIYRIAIYHGMPIYTGI